jgi:PAS domain S-box-containing protein
MRLMPDAPGPGAAGVRQQRPSAPLSPKPTQSAPWRTTMMRYFLAAAAAPIAGLAHWWLVSMFGPMSPFLTFYPGVLIAALFAGTGPGVLALALSVLLVRHMPAAETGTAAAVTPVDPAALSVFIGMNLVFCLMAEWWRRARLTETAASRQTELLTLTMASIGEGVIATDVEGRVIFINDAAGSLLGCAPSAVQGAPFGSVFKAINALNREPVANLVDSALNPGSRAGAADSRALIRSDGREVAIELSCAPIRSDNGTVRGVVVTFRDCSERRQAEQEAQRLLETVQAEKEWFSQVLSSINEEVYFTDTQKRFTFANAAAMREFGHTSVKGIEVEKVLANLVVLRSDGTPRPIEEAPPLRALAGEVIRDEEHIVRIPRTGELRHRQVSSAPVRDASGRIIGSVSVVRDITERKRAEASLREADHRKDVFLATLSHELRNPLAPILTAARLLESPGVTSAELESCVSIISRQVTHMASLLNDLLDVSRFTRGELTLKMQRVRLQELLDAAVETAQPLIDAKCHRLHLDVPSAPLMLEVDPVRLTQVVSNLLANAAKYTNPGGDITLGSRLEVDALVIFVRDTGIGLAADNVADIFEIFVQLEPAKARAQGGLGIGLALVKGLVELHGGRIHVESAGRDRGSTFNVTFPRSVVIAEPDAQADTPTAAFAREEKSRCVLIADDARDGAAALAMLLQRAGHEVHVAHNGLEALKLAAQVKPDIAFLDIGMPGLSGYEVAMGIRREAWGRQIMLIAVTGWGQEEDKRSAHAAGFDRHFTKPMDPRRLKSIFASRPLSRRLRGGS